MSHSAELRKVTMGPREDAMSDEGGHSDSEPESDVTVEEEDAEEGKEYDVELIKYAAWRDARTLRVTSKNKPGWRYGVMWVGYLKAASDGEEPLASFNHIAGELDLIEEFWDAFDHKTSPWTKRAKGKREPAKPPGHLINRPIPSEPHLLKRKMKESKGRRLYHIYVGRTKWQEEHPLEVVPKRWSDYYVYRRAREQRKKEKREARREGSKASDQPATASTVGQYEPVTAGSGPSSAVSAPAEFHRRERSSSRKPKSSSPTKSAEPSKSSSPNKESRGKEKVHEKSEPSDDFAPVDTNAEPKSAAPRTVATPGRSTAQTPVSFSDLDTMFDSDHEDNVSAPSAPVPGTSKAQLAELIDLDSTKVGQKRKSPSSDHPTQLPHAPPSKISKLSEPAGPSLLERAKKHLKLKSTPSGSASLASMGKITKRKDDLVASHQGSSSASRPSFGDPEPGIFEPPTPVSMGDSRAKTQSPSNSVPNEFLNSMPAPAMPNDVQAVRSPPPAVKVMQPTPPSKAKSSGSSPTTTGSSKLPSPPQPSVPLASRPKYVQPKRITVLEQGEIPIPGARGKRMNVPSSVPAKPHSMRSPNDGGRTPPDAAGGYHARTAVVPPSAPTGPRNWPNKAPPSGPSSSRSAYTPRQPSQDASYFDTNIGGMSPVHPSDTATPSLAPLGGVSPLGAVAPPNVYNAAADPRRKGNARAAAAAMTSPLGMMSPRSPNPNAKPIATIIPMPGEYVPTTDNRFSVPLRDSNDMTVLDVRAVPGFTPSSHADLICNRLLPPKSRRDEVVHFEEMDAISVHDTINLGAKLIEWARIGHVLSDPNNTGALENWNVLKGKMKSGQIYVAYSALESGSPKHHYALVMASPELLDLQSFGLGNWHLASVSVALMILELPLTSVEAPILPNPVRPMQVLGSSKDFKPSTDELSKGSSAWSLLDSFGIDQQFFGRYADQTISVYPQANDTLYNALITECRSHRIIPSRAGTYPDMIFTFNQRLSRVLRSNTIREALPRRIPFYAAGPNLSLYPSQWKLQPIWQRGGLVTFSPTFILRSPDKFAEIMKMIRVTDSWAAYVIPSVIDWCQESWTESSRCPDPSKAYETLTKALFLDEHVLQLSGSLATSGGGLAVSCAPPNIHDQEGCMSWIKWLSNMVEQTDLQGIASLCAGANQWIMGDQGEERKSTQSLALVDIEHAQMEDLTAMRMKPHLLPYRRYIYVGEVSLSQRDKMRQSQSIELVAAEDFTAIFSGAV